MVRAVDSGVTTAPALKRENCSHTKHDSAFSDWKILIGACDWEDYLLHKEGAERYRTHNLPNCASCPGLYELGIAVSVTVTKGKSISKLDSKNIIPVYLGQADNVRTRLQQYGRDGDHLENGLSKGEQNDRKVLGLFSDIFSYGFAIAFRWAPMESKKDAEKTESQLLKTFDYAWNRGMNGERRPDDIHKKLGDTVSNPKRVFSVLKKIRVFPSKEVGLRIKHCDPPVLENGSSFYTKQNDTNTLLNIFKFGRSRPTLVSKDSNMNNDNVRICGVALGHGSICIRPPVKGRKRCVDHKGMKVNAHIKPRLDLETGRVCNSQKGCKEVEHEGMMVNEKKSTMPGADSLTCVAITVKGSRCSRKPEEVSLQKAHRVAHKLWTQSRKPLALALQSRISDVFAVDIHPGAKLGKGILFDHATGVVVGETAVIGNNVSILHHVTLGGTGKAGGDRHPKIGDGVLIGAGATILGNVKIGAGAKIGAGSVVLINVPPRATAVGNPARLVEEKEGSKVEECPGMSMDHTSFISDWSDYTI